MEIERMKVLMEEMARRQMPVEPLEPFLREMQERAAAGFEIGLQVKRLGPEQLAFKPACSSYTWSGGGRWLREHAVLVLRNGSTVGVKPEEDWATGSGERGFRPGRTVGEAILHDVISVDQIAYLVVDRNSGQDFDDCYKAYRVAVFLRPRVEELQRALEEELKRIKAEVAAEVTAALGE